MESHKNNAKGMDSSSYEIGVVEVEEDVVEKRVSKVDMPLGGFKVSPMKDRVELRSVPVPEGGNVLPGVMTGRVGKKGKRKSSEKNRSSGSANPASRPAVRVNHWSFIPRVKIEVVNMEDGKSHVDPRFKRRDRVDCVQKTQFACLRS